MTVSVSDRLDMYNEKMVGKQIRNKNLIVIGTIAEIICIHNTRWNRDYYYAVLDDGQRVDLFHYGIQE